MSASADVVPMCFRSVLLQSLQPLRHCVGLHVIVDRGHRYSAGNAFANFWITPTLPNVGPSPAGHTCDDVDDDDNHGMRNALDSTDIVPAPKVTKPAPEPQPIKGIPANEFRSRCDLIFEKFDEDNDQLLNYDELVALLGRRIEDFDVFVLCNNLGCDARVGLSKTDVYKLLALAPQDVWEEVYRSGIPLAPSFSFVPAPKVTKPAPEPQPIKGIPVNDFRSRCDLICEKNHTDNDQLLNYDELVALLGRRSEDIDVHVLCNSLGCDARVGLSKTDVYKLFAIAPQDVWEEVYRSVIPLAPSFSFVIGMTIEVQGLIARPELNGIRGVVKEFDALGGRFAVALEGGRGSFKLKPVNLKVPNTSTGRDIMRVAATRHGAALESYLRRI